MSTLTKYGPVKKKIKAVALTALAALAVYVGVHASDIFPAQYVLIAGLILTPLAGWFKKEASLEEDQSVQPETLLSPGEGQ